MPASIFVRVAHSSAPKASQRASQNATTSQNNAFYAIFNHLARGLSLPSPPVPIAESRSVSDLTDRQLEILTAATQGLTTNDIAKELDISVSCVLKHFTVIFEKLGVANRAEAVAIALRKHLLTI